MPRRRTCARRRKSESFVASDSSSLNDAHLTVIAFSPSPRLRQVDVKAEHYERQVQRAEQERDQWEQKYEEAQEKYHASKRELDEVVQQMESL